MAKTTDMPQASYHRGALKPGYDKVLTPAAIAFRRRARAQIPARSDGRLLARRADIQHRLDAGWKPDFLPETKAIRDGDWRVAPIPRDIMDRRIEITGPTDRKMVINALNCGANVYMADFEDADHAELGQPDRRADATSATRCGGRSPSTIRKPAGTMR